MSQLIFSSKLPAAMLAMSMAFQAYAVEGTGLQTSASVNAVGSYKVDKDDEASNRIDIREAELTLYSPIDHVFDGKLSLAAHQEAGESLFELHEAVISSSKLIPYSSLKVGQYFLGVGRLNRTHPHEWPFISAPKVHEEFFGKEGALDTGAEISTLVPASFFINISAGVTNGWTYGHSHDEGEKPKTPTHYSRVSTFLEPSDELGIAIGSNYLSRTASNGTKMTLLGLDAVAKLARGGYNALLIQGELWHRELKPEVGNKNTTLGSYLLAQYGFSKNLYASIRADYFTVASLKDATGEKIDNSEYSVVPTLTYKPSEFSTFRLAFNHSTSTQSRLDDETNKTIELQSNFIIGAHPAHDF